MDRPTTFSHRHSLNGREAAAHLQRRTTEHYTSSAQLLHWRSSPKRDLSACLFYFHLYQHSFQWQEKLQPGFKLEDEEKNSFSLVTVLQTKTLYPDK